MAKLKQKITLKKATNKKAKYKIKVTKYTYTNRNTSNTQKYSYVAKKLTTSKIKNKYSYV